MCGSRLSLCLVALAACGDNAQRVADAPPAITCNASFTGNYAEQSTGPDDCATLASDGTLALHVPIATLSATLDVSISLGATPTPGRMTSETVSAWSASVEARCTYGAGSSVVPPGNFELTLDALAPAAGSAHGTLAITQYLLQFPGIPYCGPYDTELATLTF